MSELLEVVKLILSSNVMPTTAFVLMLPSILDSLLAFMEFYTLIYILIRFRRGFKEILLKLVE